MRKVLSLMAGLMSAAAFGGGSTVEAPAANVLGYTCIDSRRAYLPIAISYDDSAVVSGVDLAVKDVVQTSTLTVGDELYVYNHLRHNYDTYTLATNAAQTAKEWMPMPTKVITLGGTSDQTSASADENLLSKGYGLWLHRKGDSVNSIVHVMGQLATNITVTVKSGETVLLGVPSEFDKVGLDLTSDKSPIKDKAEKNDLIEVPKDDGTLAIYKFDGLEWKPAVSRTVLSVIPAGSAFWYLRKGASELTVEWPL